MLKPLICYVSGFVHKRAKTSTKQYQQDLFEKVSGSFCYLTDHIGWGLRATSIAFCRISCLMSSLFSLPVKLSVASFKSCVSFLYKFIRKDKLPLKCSLLLFPAAMYKEEGCHLRGGCESELWGMSLSHFFSAMPLKSLPELPIKYSYFWMQLDCHFYLTALISSLQQCTSFVLGP